MSYLGIDIGTSGVKAMLVDEAQELLASSHSSLQWTSPQPGWAEQDPHHWWSATLEAIGLAREAAPRAFAGLRGIALSGQMHGATLLDAQGEVLRPAMLWNDTRAFAECVELEQACPDARRIIGNLVLPGFTAPKLLWVREHEPALFDRVRKVLLPKDYVAWRLSGEFITDMSDASGTSWLDVGARRWSAAMLAACGLDQSAMPKAFEGSAPAALLSPALRREWGLAHDVVIAAGAGDNAAAAVGMGVVDAGQAMISLGTSGVMFAGNDRFLPNPEGGVHAFCHCIPGRWHQMTVILSAAASLSWLAELTRTPASDLAALAERADPLHAPTVLPYLNGERSPHNDPHARGVFFGLATSHGTPELAYAVLEGVAFAIADGQRSLEAAGTTLGDAFLVGGGSRSTLWARLLAAATGLRLHVPQGGDLGGAFGAARLALLAATGSAPVQVCTVPATASLHEPEAALAEVLQARYARYRDLYQRLREPFREFAGAREAGARPR
jgi:xylulokinase